MYCEERNIIVRGCLKLTAGLVYAAMSLVGHLVGGIGLTCEMVQSGVELNASQVGGIALSASPATEPLTLSASLVCGVNVQGDYEYLQVIEGNVILLEDGYCLVLRNNG